ncbi:MAG TPA: hypothetical protein VGQ99_11000 [Tepidisphaeraceae bacterium]|jgi:hypothetical protein|nr:hypothetical protein [Tepidisphaeraceae bacterium]
MFLQPLFALWLCDDCHNIDLARIDIIVDPQLTNAKPVLWMFYTAKAFDAAFADLLRFESQVFLDRDSYRCSIKRTQPGDIFDSSRCEDDLVPHSGHILARLCFPAIRHMKFDRRRPGLYNNWRWAA